MNHSDSRESPSRKEREKLARQQEILKAARELFVTKGFRETTLEEIARLAEFGKGTLYNYFASKEDLFIGIIEQVTDEMRSIADEAIAAPGTANEKLHLYARKMISYIKNNGELVHVVYHELHRGDSPVHVAKLRQIIGRSRHAWEVLAQTLTEGMQSKLFRDCDPMELIVLFDGMLRGYCFHRFAVGHTEADEDITVAADRIISVFFDGIVERKDKG